MEEKQILPNEEWAVVKVPVQETEAIVNSHTKEVLTIPEALVRILNKLQ